MNSLQQALVGSGLVEEEEYKQEKSGIPRELSLILEEIEELGKKLRNCFPPDFGQKLELLGVEVCLVAAVTTSEKLLALEDLRRIMTRALETNYR